MARDLEDLLDALTRSLNQTGGTGSSLEHLNRTISSLSGRLDKLALPTPAKPADQDQPTGPGGAEAAAFPLEKLAATIRESLAARTEPVTASAPPQHDIRQLGPKELPFQPKGLLTYLEDKIDALGARAIPPTPPPIPAQATGSTVKGGAVPVNVVAAASHILAALAAQAGGAGGGRGGPPQPPAPPATPPSPGGEGPRGFWGRLSDLLSRVNSGLGTALSEWSNPGAVVNRGEQLKAEGQGVRGGLTAAAGKAMQGLQDPSELQGGAALLGSVGELAGAFGGPAGAAVLGVTKFAEKIVEGVEKLRAWNEQLRQADLRFAEYSGKMAAVEAESEARRIRLGIEQGDNRSESARFRQESSDQLDRTLAPLEDLTAIFRNNVAGYFNQIVNGIMTLPGDIAKKILEALGIKRGEQENRSGVVDLDEWRARVQQDLAQEKQVTRPPRFRGGADRVRTVMGDWS